MTSSRLLRLASLRPGILLVATLLALHSAKADDYFPPSDAEGGWRSLSDDASIREKAGMRLDRLNQAFEFTQRCSQSGGLLVVRHGYLVYEKYYGRAHRNANPDMASTGKAFTSIACGIMLQDYINERLAKPMGWGAWGYCLHLGDVHLPHANGAGSIALHSTDALRFGYCLLQKGRWKQQQLVPADYIALCNQPSPHNPHTPYSLMFEHNSDGHVAGAPRDAYYKSGAGGFGLFVVPSLDLVIYKLGGHNGQYDPKLTGIPQTAAPDTSRDTWKSIPRTPFNEGSMGGDDGLRRVLEMVSAAVVE